ncbi:MAG TPA: hypothetical protein VEL31_09325 [Ktedonobacteraceae bacterium]|nr:hypothetical protein [Ktedonobacteraceae bacterium]
MFEWRDVLFTLLLLISGISWILGFDLPQRESREPVASHDLRVGGDITDDANGTTVADVSHALDVLCQDQPHARR